LNIAPYQIPHSANAPAASRPAREPAIARAVAHTATMPPTPVRERKYSLEADRDDVEEAPVEVEIPEVEQSLIRKGAAVVRDDEFAVALLDLLIVGDGIIAERRENEDNQ
jgi:hypothetical protein